MTQEIIYTSAARGLKLGSKGFCTVASTRNMAKPVAERLESLSGYRHLFPPGDPRNLLTYSHVILTIANKKYHVLSRIADAGYDYSQRSNKIAHHVALAQRETIPAGPAWLLSQPGFMETTWSGEPRFFETGRVVPSEPFEPQVCEMWQRLAGDAGWGGVLAESVWNKNQNEVYVIYKEGIDVLRLMLESQSLLPEKRRWLATFTTNYTKLPPHVECRWRCVLEGSDEAAKIQRMRHVTVLDLSQPLGPPPAGPAVDAARSGQIIGSRTEEPRARVCDDEMEVAAATDVELTNAPLTPVVPPRREAELGLAQPEVPPPRKMATVGRRGRDVVGSKRSRIFKMVGVGLIAVSLLVVVATAAFYLGEHRGTRVHVARNEGSESTDSGDETRPPEREDSGVNSKVGANDPKRKEENDAVPEPEMAKSDPEPAAEEEDNGATGKDDDESLNGKQDANADNKIDASTTGGAIDHPDTSRQITSKKEPRKSKGELDSKRANVGEKGMDMPKNVGLDSLWQVDSRPLRIGAIGSCKGLSLKLLHPRFRLEHEKDTLLWSVFDEEKSLGTFEIKEVKNKGDRDLVFSLSPGGKAALTSFSKGALYVQCKDCSPALILLRKAEPAKIELRLTQNKYTDDAKIKKTPFDPGSLYVSGAIFRGNRVSDGCTPQLETPKKKVTIPLLKGVTHPLDLEISCSPSKSGQVGMVQARFCRKNTAYTVKMRSDFYKNYYSQCQKCESDLVKKRKQLKQKREESSSTKSDAKRQNQLKREIQDLENEKNNIKTKRDELEALWRFFEGFKTGNTRIVITLTLCHLYDEIQIPVTEDELK